MRKARGEAILKNLPDPLQDEIWRVTGKTTYAKACAWLKEKHEIEVSEPTLQEFFSWYPRSRTLRVAAASSDQLKETLLKMPELKLKAEQAAQVAQVSFELQAAQERDPALFAALRRGELERDRLQLEREKFEESKKEDWEKGLDALHEEIKGCPDALRHFEAMTAALKKAKH